MLRTWFEPCHVGQSQGALWSVIRTALIVAGEELGDFTLAGCHDDQIGVPGVALELLDTGVLKDELATAGNEFLHEAREFHALVDRLGRLLKAAGPAQGFLAGLPRARDGEGDAVNRWCIVPEIQGEGALVFECIVEHALARGNLAVTDFVRRAVGNGCDLEACVQQSDSELETRLTCADNGDVSF